MGAAVDASRSGDLLNDTYELCELVESRDTHQLYSARDTRNDRVVHIALMRPEVALRNGVAQRFIKGPKALATIDHPNVGRVWSVESDATGIPFVVEEPRSGQSLATMIDSFPEGMPLGVAVNLLVPVVEAFAAAHGSGLVHGAFDAKHVSLCEQSGTTVPKVFGFAAGDKPSSPGEDVHALGALLYRALSGQSASGKRRAPLDELAPHLPLELTELVERCLADKDERPADARLLSDELSSLRQKIGGQRASAVSTERFVQRDSPAPAPPKKVSAKPADKAAELERRRVIMERAETAPIEPPPVAAPEPAPAAVNAEPAPVKIDALGATAIDIEPPRHDRDSIEFPMASLRPAHAAEKPQPQPKTPDQIETKVDEPAPEPQAKAEAPAPDQTREDRGAARGKRAAKEKKEVPAIAVAGPARLAAAFAPLEGASNIEQGETHEAGLVREFKRQQEEERAKREARYGRPMPMSDAAATAAAKPNAAALLGGTKPADAKKQAARPSAAEVIALSQIHKLEEDQKERRSRFVGALFLMLFCFLLVRAVPLLTGPRAQVEEVLGPRMKLAAVAFAALSLVVLIKTWALQIQSKAVLLKPVTYTLKVVVICAAVLCAGLLMPAGALGFFEGVARRFLPWSAAAYFLFLGFYGVMQGVRQTQSNLVAGLSMALAYGGSFVGSYMIAANVIVPNVRAGRAQAEMAMQIMKAQENGEQVDPQLLLKGSGVDPDVAAQVAEQAKAEDGFKETKMVGASEESDMESIREMGAARKRNAKRLDELKDTLPELAK